MRPILIYTTLPDLVSAESLAHGLLTEKLVACANIIPQMYSMYWWNDKIHQDQELVVILKTGEDYFERVQAWIKKNHPSDIPCILSWSIEKGDADYVNWLSQSLLRS